VAVNNGTVSIATAGGPFTILSGNPFSVPAFGSTNVVVQFAPTSVGGFTNTLIFGTANGGNSANQVTGTGLTPARIGVSPTDWNFGGIATGASTQTTFVVTNSGGVAVNNGTVSIATAGGPFTILSGNPFSAAVGATTNVVVQFAPTSAGGFTNNVIFVTANGGNSTNQVTGTGAIVPVALFTGSPTNGAAPLAVTFIDGSTGTITNRFWSFGDGNASNTTATSLSHTYSSVGTNTVSLTVYGPLGTNSQARTNYIVAVNAAHLVVNPGSLSYGAVTVGLTNSLNLSVINTGDLSLIGTVVTASPFLIANGSPYTVAGGQTATVSVAFAPAASGTFTGSVAFASNGGTSTNTVIGTSLTPGSIGVTPASHDFGTMTTGTTAQITFVVTNSGGTAVSNGTASVSGPFTIVSGSTFGIAGFGTANVVVQFAPVAVGGFTNSVIFISANGGTATNTVSGTGAIVPVAQFTGSPTNGMAPLVVTFSNQSTGTITDLTWNFGDGHTSNATNPTHTYSNVATFSVSLTVIGPVGSNTLNRSGYITVGNPLPPVITNGPTVTNPLLQVGNLPVVVAGDTNVFTVGAMDPGGNQLSYRWLFGDGATNVWSALSVAQHAYTTNYCGPYAASVTVSNGWTAISTNLTVAVACQLTITKLQLNLNFAKTNADGCTVAGRFELPASYSFSNRLATLDIGGAKTSISLGSKGSGRNGLSIFNKPTYNKKTGWTFNASLKDGSWQATWAEYSMINSNIPKPRVVVTNFPVTLVLDTEAFMGTTNLHYTAKQDVSGTAK